MTTINTPVDLESFLCALHRQSEGTESLTVGHEESDAEPLS
jgi:hypothetical protein